MKEIIERGATSQIVHVFIPDSTSGAGAGKTGLTSSSSGLVVAVIRPGEASATVYAQASSNIEAVTTIGTYAAPTASKCRFKEIDATNLPGWYEIHFANALFNTTSSRRSLGGMIHGASGVVPTAFQIQLSDPSLGVGSPSGLATASVQTQMAGDLITVSNVVTDTSTAVSNLPTTVADSVWDEETSGHVTVGTFGELYAWLRAIVRSFGGLR